MRAAAAPGQHPNGDRGRTPLLRRRGFHACPGSANRTRAKMGGGTAGSRYWLGVVAIAEYLPQHEADQADRRQDDLARVNADLHRAKVDVDMAIGLVGFGL